MQLSCEFLRANPRAVKSWWLPLLLAFVAPLETRGEMIYAVAHGSDDHYLIRVDSATPWALEEALRITGTLEEYIRASLEFDPATGDLYGFAYPRCPITCPTTPIDPVKIDPITGGSSQLSWPGFPSDAVDFHDVDIDPLTREVRLFGRNEENFRYSLDELQLHVDAMLDTPGRYVAVAHTAPVRGGSGVETLAIYYPPEYGQGPYLVRVGGPGGVPPASTGEVTVIGSITDAGYVYGFDIAADGTAYLLAEQPPGVHRLYTLDLESLEATEKGVIATPIPGLFVSAIAVAPRGSSARILEIPTLSRIGLAVLALALGSAALRWARRLNRGSGR